MATSARESTEIPGSEVLEIPLTTSSPHSLSQAVHARRAEYTRLHKIKVKVGSWNVAACPGTEKDLGGWFVEGKGIHRRLAGLEISQAIEENDSQANIKSVAAQESRRKKKQSTIPRGDDGTVIGGEDIGLYALGLQEVVELTSAKEYFGRVYTDPGPTVKWRKALMDALPPGYTLISEQQLSGLLLFIVASPSVAPTISSVSSVSVGTGIMGYLGNKGAVSTRIVLGDTTRLVFVNSHLASGKDPSHLDRRVWDVQQILQRTHFDPISWSGVLDDNHEGIGDEDFAFWFGDLNFRIEGLPGEDIRRLLMLHTKGEYGGGEKPLKKIDKELVDNDGPIIIRSIDSDDDSEDEEQRRASSTFDPADDTSSTTLPDPDDFMQDPSQDPTSLQATIDSLLPHDQLRHVQKTKRAFHDGWREGPITFLPTYKYDVGSMGMFDSSEKKRAPSWCDRILFRTRRDKLEYDELTREAELARIKDEEMKARGIDHATDDEDVLFDYDPDEDGADETAEGTPANNDYDEYDEYNEAEGGTEPVISEEGVLDKIHLEFYVSHQRVLSSDHKPLDAVFTLDYDAVVPELKSKVQQEVARELDRAENEGRPGITIVVDHSHDVEEIPERDATSPRRPSTGDAGINFGDVEFLRRKTRSLTIANTSQVKSTFAFVDRPSVSGDGDRIAPTWLSVCFVGSDLDEDERVQKDLERQVTLEPGDAINATLEVFIDDLTLVKSLNDGLATLDDILVLRVTNGRDHFIPVRGSWMPTCFCRSIDELIRIPEGGVRGLQLNPNASKPKDICWPAPRELFRLTETIEILTERVIADAAMIESSQLPKESLGWPFDPKSWLLKDPASREMRKGYVIEALDTDKSLSESFPPEIPAIERIEIVAEILVLFLTSLTDGIITATLWDKLEFDIVSRTNKPLTDPDDIKIWVLDVLSSSPNHNISLVFLTSMLQRVAGELAPMPKVRHSFEGSIRGSFDTVRRSLSWNGKKTQTIPDDPAVTRRQGVDRAFVDVFAGVVFRGQIPFKEKERRIMDERRREILETFLRIPGPGA